jgi:hypothetical protein
MTKKKKRNVYHTFRRRLSSGEIFRKRCLEKPGTALVTIFLTLADIDKALSMDGQADGQNCAGAVCTRSPRHRDLFNHKVGYFIDWWRTRVYIDEDHLKRNICRVYAHYDQTEGLFDTKEGLIKLRKLVEKAGPHGLKITLYPVKPGHHARTGKPSSRSGPRVTGPGTGGGRRQIAGGELRYENYMRARMAS